MAEAFFNKFSKNNKGESAGTNVFENEGQKIKDNKKAGFVIDSMIEEGIDVSACKRKQLTEKMADGADKIIMITEKESWPEYIKESKKVIFWEIEDPMNTDLESHRETRNEIKMRVLKLIDEIEDDKY